MVTILEYAKLSAHIYIPHQYLFDRTEKDFLLHTVTIAAKANKKGWYYCPDVNPNYTSLHPFFPALYVKFVNNQATDAVIAIRGSKDMDNYRVDIETWWPDVVHAALSDDFPVYYPWAIKFLHEAKAYIKQYFPKARLSMTGHSLGGALVQSIVGCSGQPYQTVTFNAPGIGHFKNIVLDMQHWVTNINSRYGFINKIGKRFGNVIYVDVVEKEAEAKAVWQALHDMNAAKAELKQATSLETIELMNRIELDLMTAKTDFLISVYPQHKIDNMVEAVLTQSTSMAA